MKLILYNNFSENNTVGLLNSNYDVKLYNCKIEDNTTNIQGNVDIL